MKSTFPHTPQNAGQAGSKAADSEAASDAQEVGGSLGHPYVVSLVLWATFLGISAVALCKLLNPATAWRNTAGHALLEMCGVLITGGIVYCLWVQYCVTTERRTLLATIAFSGLMLGQSVHALTSAIGSDGWGMLKRVGLQYYVAWQVAAACLLIAAARSTAVDSKPNCRKSGLRSLLSMLGLSLFLTAAAVALSRSCPRIQETFPNAPIEDFHRAFRWASSFPLIHILPMVATVAALVVFARRYIREEDAFSNSVTRCLLLALSAYAVRLMSPNPYDLAWWAAHVLGVAALGALLIELAVEFGASYADAQARIEHLEAVHHISSRMSNTLDLRVVLLVLVSDIADMLSARFASVMLVDDSGETLKTVATHGLPEFPLRPSEPQKLEGNGRPGFYSGHTARAFKEKRVCVVEDVYTDVEFVPWRLLAQCNGYAVSVPLVYQDVALGVLNLFFDEHIPLNDERIRLFETLASAAAVAIANAQLYDRTVEAQSEDADVPTLVRLKLAA